MNKGELEKMRIVAYKKANYKESEKVQDGAFNVKVNPETYTLNFEIEYDEDQAPGTSNKQPKFNKTKPMVLEFKFLFDSTGALPGTTDEQRMNGIEEELEQFKKCVFSYDGEIHRPPFILLSWGILLFKCVLTNMAIKYKLFRPDGSPVRAEVDCKFQGLLENKERVAKQKDSSPDLTHVRVVKAGDKLPLMCERIYGDTKYYVEVARANNLVNFRRLEAGQKIFFPPIEKS